MMIIQLLYDDSSHEITGRRKERVYPLLVSDFRVISVEILMMKRGWSPHIYFHPLRFKNELGNICSMVSFFCVCVCVGQSVPMVSSVAETCKCIVTIFRYLQYYLFLFSRDLVKNTCAENQVK